MQIINIAFLDYDILKFNSLKLLASFVFFSPFFYLIVPLCALCTNVVMLLEVEQRSSAILRERDDLERRADKDISELSNNILFLLAFTGGICHLYSIDVFIFGRNIHSRRHGKIKDYTNEHVHRGFYRKI